MRATDVKAEAEVRGCVCCGHCACVGARCKMAAVGDGTGSTGSALQGLIRQFTAITGKEPSDRTYAAAKVGWESGILEEPLEGECSLQGAGGGRFGAWAIEQARMLEPQL